MWIWKKYCCNQLVFRLVWMENRLYNYTKHLQVQDSLYTLDDFDCNHKPWPVFTNLSLNIFHLCRGLLCETIVVIQGVIDINNYHMHIKQICWFSIQNSVADPEEYRGHMHALPHPYLQKISTNSVTTYESLQLMKACICSIYSTTHGQT